MGGHCCCGGSRVVLVIREDGFVVGEEDSEVTKEELEV